MTKVEIKTHPINSNTIVCENSETVLLGAEIVKVGINTGEKTVVTDSITGYKSIQDKIEGQTVYELRTQKHRPWFVLDLETGSRGWYPGCLIYAEIIGQEVEVKEEESVDSTTLKIVPQGTKVKILNVLDGTNTLVWYFIECEDVQGYVRTNLISNIQYVDPIK